MKCILFFILILVARSAIAFTEGVDGISLSTSSDNFNCEGIFNSYECALIYERKILESNQEILKKENGNLKITLHNKKLFEIKNSDHLIYLPITVSLNKRFVALFIQYEVGTYWGIFDRTSGKVTPICGLPIFSPEEKSFVCSEIDLYSDFNPNCLEVYSIGNKSIHKKFEADTGDSWGPRSTRWINEDSIEFERVELIKQNPNGEDGFISLNKKIINSKGIWKID